MGMEIKNPHTQVLGRGRRWAYKFKAVIWECIPGESLPVDMSRCDQMEIGNKESEKDLDLYNNDKTIILKTQENHSGLHLDDSIHP